LISPSSKHARRSNHVKEQDDEDDEDVEVLEHPTHLARLCQDTNSIVENLITLTTEIREIKKILEMICVDKKPKDDETTPVTEPVRESQEEELVDEVDY